MSRRPFRPVFVFLAMLVAAATVAILVNRRRAMPQADRTPQGLVSTTDSSAGREDPDEDPPCLASRLGFPCQ